MLTPSGGKQEPLRVGWMVLALVVAAFLGGSLGLAWQAFSGDDEPQEQAGETTAEPE